MADLDEHARKGIAAINDGDIETAIEQFEQALEIAPDRPDINNLLGTTYLRRGQAATAVPHLEKAVKLGEQYADDEYAEVKADFMCGLATAYQLSDRIGDAVTTLREAAERFPAEVRPRMQLGQLLLTSCQLEEGLDIYRELAEFEELDDKGREAANAILGAVDVFQQSEEYDANVFLRAHRDSYVEYFDEIASKQEGWYPEASRMAEGDDGELKPVLPEGAREYAMVRVDLVDPESGEVAGVYSDTEPMVVAVEGLEPLAQIPIMFPWQAHELDVWVCSQVPWHWLTITVQLDEPTTEDARIDILDGIFGEWYLAGFNGDFGEQDKGRFHYITDPEPVGGRALAYTVDLGRTEYPAIEALLQRLLVLNAKTPIRRILIGNGYLPD